MAAIQAVTVLSHLAVILKAVKLPVYYRNTVQLWAYPQILLLAVGTLRHRLRTQPSRLEAWIGHLAHVLWQLSKRGRPAAADPGAAPRD